jgi:MFS family permease
MNADVGSTNDLAPHDPYGALRFGDFRLALAGDFLAYLGEQMLGLGIGWELYDRTNSPLALGLVGLVQLVPILLLSLFAGHLADRYPRQPILVGTQVALVGVSVALAILSSVRGPLVAVYACLLVRGLVAAFRDPAEVAFRGEVVPEDVFENAASWRNSIGTLAAIAGPAAGGFLVATSGGTASLYALTALTGALAAVALAFIRGRRSRSPASPEASTWQSIGEGIRFLRRTPVMSWAITLDLFAVLFGGATTLLPVFARDILAVGPVGLGWLEAAPWLGVVGFSLFLAHRPPLGRAGPTFLLVVAGFGLATVVFGLSRSFGLSLAILFLLGGFDGVSMIVRDTLNLTRVPPEMRGRVGAIEGIFVNSSNQLGGFESGLAAQLVGPVLAVVGGGVATVLVVIGIAAVAPELRRLRAMRTGPT